MLSLIIQITVVSIIFIFVVHYLINFFKDNLTVPKTKDLVNAPNKKYESMYNVISSSFSPPPASSSNYNVYDLLPVVPTTKVVNNNNNDQESMKDELKSFLKKQLQVASSSTEISTLFATPSFADY